MEDRPDAGTSKDQQERDAKAVAAERTGRTNTARDMVSGADQGPPPGRWDSIGEPGEGLDELQGLYAADATGQEQLPERGEERHLPPAGPPLRPRPRSPLPSGTG